MTKINLKQLNIVLICLNGLLIMIAASSKMIPLDLGIDQPTPVSSLDVNGNVTIGSTYSGTNAAPTNGMLVEGDVGIGVTSPNTKMDLNGDMAFRMVTQDIGDNGGTNKFDDLALNADYSLIKITGPTGNYEIYGITGGADGRLLILNNDTEHSLKFKNEQTTSAAANRILTSEGGDIQIKKYSTGLLIYSAIDSRWLTLVGEK